MKANLANNPEDVQVKTLLEQGMCLEEIAIFVKRPVEDIKASLSAKAQAGLIKLDDDAEAYRSKNALKMLKVLEEIAEDTEAHPSARVAAAKAFIDTEIDKEGSSDNVSKFAALMEDMKRVVSKQIPVTSSDKEDKPKVLVSQTHSTGTLVSA